MCRSKHVEQLRNIGIINSTTRSHLVGSFYEIYITMHGSLNIMSWHIPCVNQNKVLSDIKHFLYLLVYRRKYKLVNSGTYEENRRYYLGPDLNFGRRQQVHYSLSDQWLFCLFTVQLNEWITETVPPPPNRHSHSVTTPPPCLF